MKPEAQRIAIAEACGWKKSELEPCVYWREGEWVLVTDLPDYLNDLNAMYEAEKMLPNHQWSDFTIHLFLILEIADNDSWTNNEVFAMLHATAAQRAEAFLRTLGLWKETE